MVAEKGAVVLTLNRQYDNIIKVFKSIRDVGKMNRKNVGTG